MIDHKYLDVNDIIYKSEDLSIIFLCEKTKFKRSKYQYYLPNYKEKSSYVIFNGIGDNKIIDFFDLDIREVNDLLFSLIEGLGLLFFVNHKINPNVKDCVKSTKKYIMDSIYKLNMSEQKEDFISHHYHLIKHMFSDQQLKTHLDEDSYKFFNSKEEII